MQYDLNRIIFRAVEHLQNLRTKLSPLTHILTSEFYIRNYFVHGSITQTGKMSVYLPLEKMNAKKIGMKRLTKSQLS